MLTTCADNITRLWAEKNQGFGFSTFDLAAAIEPTNYLSTSEPESSGTFVNWLSVPKLCDSKLLYPSEPTRSRLVESLKEYPDMLFQIRSNGTMIIWGVQGLGRLPPRMTKLALLFKSENVLNLQTSKYPDCPIASFLIMPAVEFSNYPEALLFAFNSKNSVLDAYAMNLEDFFSYKWTAPRIELLYSWCGPSDPPLLYSAHKILDFMATVDSLNTVYIYHICSNYGKKECLGLNLVCWKQISSKVSAIKWLPSPKKAYLLILTDSDLFLLGLEDSFKFNLDGEVMVEFVINQAIDDCEFIFFGADPSAGYIKCFTLNMKDRVVFESKSTHKIDPFRNLLDLGYFYEQCSNWNCLLFATADDDSVKCWSFKDIDSPFNEFSELEEVFSVNIGKHRKSYIKYSNASKMAYTSSDGLGTKLNVWDNFGAGIRLQLGSKIDIETDIACLDWYGTFGGDQLLAICSSSQKKIIVYGERTLNTSTTWIPISTIVSDTSDGQIIGIIWLARGAMLCFTTKESLIINSEHFKCIHSTDLDKPSHPIAIFSSRGTREHEPEVLLEYAMANRSDIVKNNLWLIYSMLKLACDHDLPICTIPHSLWRYLKSTNPIAFESESLFAEIAEENALDPVGISHFQTEFIKEKISNSSFSNRIGLPSFLSAYEEMEGFKNAIDLNGQRYLLSALYHLNSCELNKLQFRDYTWARYSDSQDTLMNILLKKFSGKLQWAEAKFLGLGWWIQSNDTLRGTFEIIARSQYWGKDSSNDPVNCALYYLALRKKSVLLGLWKVATGHPEYSKMLNFLSQNFQEEKWKTAASKNAFALLGKQRFENAAAFFLLADMLKDCANICIRYLNDPQLAVTVCRIYEGENGPVLSELMKSDLIVYAKRLPNYWMEVLLWSICKDYASVLKVITGFQRKNGDDFQPNDPRSHYLFTYLRELNVKLRKKIDFSFSALEEPEYYYSCVQNYDKAGYPILAYMLLKIKRLDILPNIRIVSNPPINPAPTQSMVASSPTGRSSSIDWTEPALPSEASILNWDEMPTQSFQKEESELDVGEFIDSNLDLVVNNVEERRSLLRLHRHTKHYMTGLIGRIISVINIYLGIPHFRRSCATV